MNHDRLALYALALAILAFLVVALLVLNSALRAGTPPAAQEAPHIAALRVDDRGWGTPSWTAGAASAYPTPGVTAPGPPPSSRAAPGTLRAVTRPASARLSGWATYFAAPNGTAAAGPALRRLIGAGWRGTWVVVCGQDHRGCATVRLTDWCACGDRRGLPTLIDLDFDTVARLGWDTGDGVYRVQVEPLR